jgi:lysophospholipase L1-like esterase
MSEVKRNGRVGREDLRSLGAVVGSIVVIVVLAGANGTPTWSRGMRQARAAPATSSAAPSNSAIVGPKVVPTAPLVATASASASAVVVPAFAPTLTIGAGTRVLVFGDSFVDAGLSQQIKKLVEARSGKVLSNAWTSSTTTAWATGDKLAGMLAGFKPDVVFVSIGANEVFLPAPETRAQYIRAIVKRLDKRPCVWVGTPLWKGETGITAVEKANCAPCTYFDSNAIAIDRGPDKIHPSSKGGAAWADALFAATVSPVAPTP